MNASPLPVHDLEFPSEESFWPEGDPTDRRVYLMPTTPPSEFVGFGVLGSTRTVLFVAHGKVEEHLGSFIERMCGEEAIVELYARPPLPAELVETYSTNPPWEGHEVEAPPGTPVRGVATSQARAYLPGSGASLGTVGRGAERTVFIIPLADHALFLALGVFDGTQKVDFAVQGSVTEGLGALIAQAVSDGSSVELRAEPPLSPEVLGRYLAR